MHLLWKCPLIPPKGSWPTGWELLTWSFSITLSCWPLSVSFQMDRKTSKMSLQQAWSWWTPASALCRSQEYSTRRITPQVKVGWTEAPSGCRVLASLFFLRRSHGAQTVFSLTMCGVKEDLEPLILTPSSLGCWDYRHVSPHAAMESSYSAGSLQTELHPQPQQLHKRELN